MPSFTRGIWQAVGSNTYASAIWVNGSGQNIAQIKGDSASTPGGFWDPWVSGSYDDSRDRLYVLVPGGDQDASTNEVIYFDMATLTWVREVDPTVGAIPPNIFYLTHTWPGPPGGAGLPQYWDDSSAASPWSSGAIWKTPVDTYTANAVGVRDLYTGLTNQRCYPCGRHTYDAICFMGSPVNKFLFWGGAGAANRMGTGVPFEYDPATKQYEALTSEMANELDTTVSGVTIRNQLLGPNMCWDSDRHRVLIYAVDRLVAYDPQGPRGNRFSQVGPTEGGGAGIINYTTMFYDNRRKRCIRFGYNTWGASGFTYWDFSGGPTTSGGVSPTLTGSISNTAAVNGTFSAPGAIYDPVADKYVLYSAFAPNLLSFMNPDTFFSTSTDFTGGSNATVVSSFRGAGKGQWKRFFYSPTYDVYGIAPNADNQVYIFAPVRTTPTLAFSDITRGKRTGNPDTSQGQTANVNGAIVTVYGQNIGSTQGTSTVSIGGVNCPTVYYWGPAVPPHCAATLTNAYQNLQMVAFQIPSTAPLGAQTIKVTVNGTDSTTLPFTIDSLGTIRLSDSFGSVQLAVNAMADGDVLYVKSATLIELDTSGLSPSNQTAIIGFPGATVSVGTSTHDAFPSGYGAFTQHKVFANLSIAGGGQPLTIGDESRAVGCYITAPNGNGSLGTLGVFGSNTATLGCEFFHCGNGPPADDQYHVLYRYGRRGLGVPFNEMGCEIGHNYFHDNNASRAINCFNALGIDNPIGDHHIHHNVIVNQQWAGIGQQAGVIGTNNIHDNLLINCGLTTLETDPGHAQAVGFFINAGYPSGSTPSAPIIINIYNNTLLNCGDTLSNDRGALQLSSSTNYTLKLKNNIFFQPNGIQYISNNSDMPSTPNAPNMSHNLWFGAGTPPAFDSTTINTNPQLRSIVSPYDLHLTNISPAVGNGTNLSLPTSADFDGVFRPTSGTWDMGAYQFAAGGSTPTPPSGSIVISYDGKLRDRVGVGSAALAPDGALDGTITVQLLATGGKTVNYVRCDMHDPNGASIGIWDTDQSSVYIIAGCATGLDSAYLNNPTTMAVNFPLDDGSAFKIFISDYQAIEFLDGNVLTVTLSFTDGTSASKSVTIGEEPPPPDPGGGPTSPSTQFNFQTMFMYGQGA